MLHYKHYTRALLSNFLCPIIHIILLTGFISLHFFIVHQKKKICRIFCLNYKLFHKFEIFFLHRTTILISTDYKPSMGPSKVPQYNWTISAPQFGRLLDTIIQIQGYPQRIGPRDDSMEFIYFLIFMIPCNCKGIES